MQKYNVYYKHNDYELIYLINEGVEGAFKELVKKYSHLICKIYYEGYRNFSKNDFVQDGLMVLYKSLKSYREEELSFYTYFSICLKRKINKLYSKKMVLEEPNLALEYVKDNNLYNKKSYVIIKELYKENKEIADIFVYCFVREMSIKRYCKLFNKNYEKIYYEYKKIIDILRKKVD